MRIPHKLMQLRVRPFPAIKKLMNTPAPAYFAAIPCNINIPAAIVLPKPRRTSYQ
jgi:hypothetical protein